MATLIMNTQKTFHLRQELQLAWNRREFSLLTIPLCSPLTSRVHQRLLCSHSQPFVQSLELSLGLGLRDEDKGALELVPGLTAQHSGGGCRSPAGKSWVLLSSHRAQMSNGCGAHSQPPDLNS